MLPWVGGDAHAPLVAGLEDADEGVLGDVDFADGFHLGFALLLLLEEFAFAGDVAAVAFGGDVFAHGGDGFAGDDLAADGGLDGDDEHLGGDDVLEFFAEVAAVGGGLFGVDDGGEGLDGFAGDEDVHLDHLLGTVAGVFVVHGAVAAGHGLELVIEIDEDLGEGDGAGEHDAGVVDGFGVLEFAAFLHEELHDVADELGGDHDEDADHGFADLADFGGLGEEGGVVDDDLRAVGLGDLVDDRRVGGDDIHVELAAEAFLDDFHVEEAEESAAEAEAEGDGGFGLEGEGGVVDLQLGHGALEVLVVAAVDGVDAGEDHRLDLLVAGEGFGAGVSGIGDGVADLDLGGGLHVGDEVADIAGGEALGGDHLGGEDTGLLDLVGFGGVEEFDAGALLHGTGEAADIGDDAAEVVVDGVEDGAAEEVVLGVVFGRGDAGDDGLEDVLDADAHLGGGGDGVLAGDGEDILELLLAFLDVRGGEVDLVDDGDDGEVLLHGEVEVRDGLGFDALGGIDHEDGTFAGGEGAGDLVGEIDVAGGVEEVELVGFAVAGLVAHGDGVGFDGDALFALEVHGIEELVHLLALGDGLGVLEESVGEGGFPVIDVGDDGEVPGEVDGHCRSGADGIREIGEI